MKYIPLTKGKSALVDDEDYEYLNQWKWSYANEGYAVRSTRVQGKQYTRYMHRELSGCEGRTDHKNQDKLDNRRENLRPATSSQNRVNRPSLNHTSSYKGVSKKKNDRWQAYIGKDNKILWLGTFDSEIHAAMAYDLWAKELHGEYAYLNFRQDTIKASENV